MTSLHPRLERLLTWHAEPCVSIYLPVGRGVPVDAIATMLRSSVRSAIEQLVARCGLTERRARDLLAPLTTLDAAELRRDGDHPTVGAFVRDGEFETCPVDRAFEQPHVVAMFQPNVLPVLAMQQRAIAHVVLGLDRHRTRALLGSLGEFSRLELDVPDEGDLTISHQRGRTFHGGRGRSGAVMTGSATNEHLDEAALASFMRRISRSVRAALPSPTTPVVVTGVEYEVSAFLAEAGLLQTDQMVHGSVGRLSDPELFALGEPIVTQWVDAAAAAATARVEEARARGRAVDTWQAARDAAQRGHLDTLLVPERYLLADASELTPVVSAAIATLQHRGTVRIAPNGLAPAVVGIARF